MQVIVLQMCFHTRTPIKILRTVRKPSAANTHSCSQQKRRSHVLAETISSAIKQGTVPDTWREYLWDPARDRGRRELLSRASWGGRGSVILLLEGITALERKRSPVSVLVWSNLGVLALQVVSPLEGVHGFLAQLLFLQKKLQKHH